MSNNQEEVKSKLWKTYGIVLGVMIGGPLIIFALQGLWNNFSNSTTSVVVSPSSSSISSPRSSSSTSQTNRPAPDAAVIEHYNFIQNKKIDRSWTNLSTSFQGSNLTKGFQEYAEWWNSVDTIDIGDVKALSVTANDAIVQADLKYHLRGGRVMSDQKKYIYLVWDNDRWLINGKSDTYIK
jgi:hypothetical protein